MSEIVSKLIEFKGTATMLFAKAPKLGGSSEYVELGVNGRGFYYVYNGAGASMKFYTAAEAVDAYNELVGLKYRLK